MHVDIEGERGYREVAKEQFGVIHREQLRAEGFSSQSIKTRLARHQLIPLLPGTYLVGGAAESWQARLMAAQLWADDCFISHRSAAALWELDGCTEELVEISLYTSKRHREITTHRLNGDDRPALRHLGPLRVSSPERTLIDLAAARPGATRLAMEDALRRRLTTLDRLWDTYELDGGNGRKGTREFRRVLTSLDERALSVRSPLERRMLTILTKIEPKGLVVDYPVRDRGKTFYLDFAYPERSLGIETLGLRWHFGTEKWQRDLARDRHLSRLGWTILYFTWDDVFRTPDAVEREVTGFLLAGG